MGQKLIRNRETLSKNNKPQKTDLKRKAQATMEVLIIMGVLVVGVIIFGTFYFGNIGERSRGSAGISRDMNESELKTSYDKAIIYDGVDQVSMDGGSSHIVPDDGDSDDEDGDEPPGSDETGPPTILVFDTRNTSDGSSGSPSPSSTGNQIGSPLEDEPLLEEIDTYNFNVDWNDDTDSNITFWSQPEATPTNSGPGNLPSSDISQIRLPLESSGTYNFNVDWNDGTNSHITSWNQPEATHTYSEPGIYEIKITGVIKGFRFNNNGDRLKLIEIKNWGNLNLGNNGYYFYGCSNLDITATDVLDLNGTTNLRGLFYKCSSLVFNESINSWDTSKVTNMGSMFNKASSFNQPLSFDTSNVINMSFMFSTASSFNQPLDFNTSSVTDMFAMFQCNGFPHFRPWNFTGGY